MQTVSLQDESLPLDAEDNMPLNETDRAWIRQEIQSAHRRRGLGKFTGFIKDWGGTSAAVAIVIFAFTQWGAYVQFRTHTGDRLDTIEHTIYGLQRSQVTSHLQSAEEEAKAGQVATANAQLRMAAESLQTLASGHVPAPPSFFQQSVERVDRLSSLGLNNASANQALMALAEYRSALQQSPNFPPSSWRVVSLPMTTSEIAEQFSKQSGLTVLRAANPDVHFFATPTGNAISVQNIVFIGGKQKLDGFTWVGVTFVGTKISFDGRYPAALDRTLFVNCTFDVSNQPHATPLLEYAALADAGTLQLNP